MINDKSPEAKVVNFTLEVNKSSEWSDANDFGINENLKPSYMSNDQMLEAMANLENEYSEVVKVRTNEAEWNRLVPTIQIGDSGKINIALFGSIYGSQPAGSCKCNECKCK